MAEDPFCEFGGVPKSGCAHCRTYGRVLGPGASLVERWSEHVIAAVAKRYAIDWPSLHKAAFPPEYDWAELHEKAAVHGLGPWIISEFYGTCRGCGGRWEPGEMIRFSEDEDGWVCSGCGSSSEA